MRGAIRGVVLLAGLALAAMWAWAAFGKGLQAEPVLETVASVIEGRRLAQVVLASVVGLEAALAVAILLRVVRGLWSSLLLLVPFTGFLWYVDARGGDMLPCGCFGRTDATVAESMTRNIWIAIGVLAVLALDAWSRRAVVDEDPTS